MANTLVSRSYLLKNEEDGRYYKCLSHFHKAGLKIVSGTTSATANTETSHAHGLLFTPSDTHIAVVFQDKAGTVYKSKASDATNIYLKGSVATIAFVVWILYERA